MNLLIYCILALTFFLMPAWGNPVPLSKTLPQPWDKEILKKPDTISFQLKKLLEEGHLEEFYVLAKKELHTSRQNLKETNRFSEKIYLDRLWMMYYIVAAPPIAIDDDPTVPEPQFISDDYYLKRSVLMQIGFGLISDKDYLDYEKKHRKKLLPLFASYSAEALKKVRESYDQNLKEKLKGIQFQPNKNDDNETNSRNYIFFTNKQILKTTRNYSLPSCINMMETLFMVNLWDYFRGQAREVEKYIRLAGYQSEEEIDELIFRTAGRTPKVEFLYQGDRGKRYERKIRSGKESHVNDRYLHPLIRAVKERERQANEQEEAGKRS